MSRRKGINTWTRRAAVIVAALAADTVIGEAPNSIHPVALYGRTMNFVEEILWTDTLAGGLRYLIAGSALALVAGSASRGLAGEVLGVYTALGRRSLIEHAQKVQETLVEGDLELARKRLSAMVGRDTAELNESAIATAVIESLAENFNDAVVASLIYGNFLGSPGALLHRAVNTLDAMVGHRDRRYYYFGKASARLDDIMGWIPARVGAAALALERPAKSLAVLARARREAMAHPSPNAGLLEATMAHLLGVSLGGEATYQGRLSARPTFGPSRPAQPSDIDLAISKVNAATRRLAGALIGIDLLLGLTGALQGQKSSGGKP